MANPVNRTINIWLNQQGIENNLKSVRAAITKTTNELAKLPAYSDEWYEKSKKLGQLKNIYKQMRSEITATGKDLKDAADAVDNFVLKAGAIASVYTVASAAVQRFISSTQEYVDAYASLDDAMSAVQKTTGMTREEVELLKNSLQSIDTRTSTEQLLKIAEIGGRMGLAKEEIRDFTEAVNKANVALGDSFQGGAEEISSILGKIALAYKETRDQNIGESLTQIGSALNEVGASANATESNIAAFVQRVGSMPEVFRPTVQQAVALGAAFEESSIDAEVASRAFGIVMNKASTDVEGFAAAMHRPAEEIENLINTNPAQFFVEFAESLNGLKGTEIGPVLKELGLNADGVNKIIGAMSTNTERFTEILNTSTTAFSEAISLDKEYATVNENAAAQLEKAKKAVQDAKAALGEELLPVITQLTQTSASGLRTAAAVVKFLTQHKGLVIGLGVAYGALHAAQKLVIAAQKEHVALSIKGTAVGNAYKSVVMLLAAAKARLAGSTAAATLAQKEFKAAFAATPWGAVIVAIGAVATGMGMLISKHRDARKAAEEFNTEVAKEQAEAQYLFEKLKNTEKGTDDYREALEKLKEKYPEVIQKHLDEEGALRDVEQAYKDVIVQIKAKIAEQLKEQQITKATEDALGKQQKALDGIRQQIVKQGKSESLANRIAGEIKQMMDAGDNYADIIKYVKQQGLDLFEGQGIFSDKSISKHLNNYLAAEAGLKKANEDAARSFDPFIKASNEEVQIQEQLNELYKSKERMSGTIFEKGIDDQIDVLLDKLAKVQEAKKAVAEEQPVEEEAKPIPPASGNDPDKKTLTARENFLKRLQQMETRAQADMLSGWEKTKQEIINKYEDLLTEANELYGEDSEEFRKVQQLKLDAISAAGQQYLEKNGKILEDFSQKFRNWQKEAAPESNNEMVDAVLGTRQKWIQRTNEASALMQELLDLRKLFVADNIDTTSLDALINKLGDEMNGMADLEAADIQKTLEKYQKDIDTFITNEQKDVTNATLSETERQKHAIREKYEDEIKLIEKLKAARQAQNGEDADVSDLEVQVEKLKKLLDQQLSNVDTQASKSANKSVWQQLAEFDWSKMGENWQSALGLMSQGLQEFANAAFDIYGSIAQIQDNMMEAELQKTQETYDAKSAALQQQLNRGVISQKAYDAKMQKLNEEKEKKERKLKHEQFAREKTANIIQATIAGVLAAVESFKNGGGFPWGLIPMAMSAATTALQIAAIASQPNPYYKGGYIRGRQYAVMGEQGDEWVASNKLLKDRETAAVIAALDEYQRGNRKALAGITFAAPDPKIMSQAVSGNGRTFAPSNQVTNNYYPADNSELLKEMKQMNDFLRDPMNRRAYISSKIQLEFEEQEREVREMARL